MAGKNGPSGVDLLITIIRISFIVSVFIFLQDWKNFDHLHVSTYRLVQLQNYAITFFPVAIASFLVICCFIDTCAIIAIKYLWLILVILVGVVIYTEVFYLIIALFMHDDRNFNNEHVNIIYRNILFVYSILAACIEAIGACITIPATIATIETMLCNFNDGEKDDINFKI